MAFKVKQSGATLKKVISERKSNRDKNKTIPVYEERVYFEGEIVQDEDLAPIHIEEYDSKKGNIRELIERVESKTRKATATTRAKKSTKKQD